MRLAVVINASAGGVVGRAERAASVGSRRRAAGCDAVIEDARGLPERIAFRIRLRGVLVPSEVASFPIQGLAA